MLRRKKRRPVDRTDLIAASALREKQFTVRATGFDPATVDMVVQRLAAELDVLELQLPDPSGQPKPGSVAAEVQQIMLGGAGGGGLAALQVTHTVVTGVEVFMVVEERKSDRG